MARGRNTTHNRYCNCYNCYSHHSGSGHGMPGNSLRHLLSDALLWVQCIEPSEELSLLECGVQLSLIVVRGLALPCFVVTNRPDMALR